MNSPHGEPALELLGSLHLGMLAAAVVLPCLLGWATCRSGSEKLLLWICRALASILVAVVVATQLLHLRDDPNILLPTLLPMHLCDWALIATVWALLEKQPSSGQSSPFDAAYYLVFGGSIHALLTPDIDRHTPDAWLVLFFVFHCTLIAAVIYLITGARRSPSPGSVNWMFWLLQLYAVMAILVNMRFDTNFGYLADKPDNYSFLEHMLPWPWYWIQLEVLAFVTLCLAYAPYWWARRRS